MRQRKGKSKRETRNESIMWGMEGKEKRGKMEVGGETGQYEPVFALWVLLEQWAGPQKKYI